MVEDVARTRRWVQDLERQYRSHAPAVDQIDVVEVVEGREGIARRFFQLVRSLSEELLAFDKPPYVAPQSEGDELQYDALRRGRRIRSIYEESAFAAAGKLQAVEASVQHGEMARVTAALPMKLFVFDRETALLPLRMEAPAVEQRGIVVYEGALLTGLVTLFELMWAQALPLNLSGPQEARQSDSPVGTDALDRQLITLMSTGQKDETIARLLGVSQRTVSRRIGELLDSMGVSSRFQAGIVAAQRGMV